MMDYSNALKIAQEKNKEMPEFPHFYFPEWSSPSRGWVVIQREYTSEERQKIGAGILYPVDDD